MSEDICSVYILSTEQQNRITQTQLCKIRKWA